MSKELLMVIGRPGSGCTTFLKAMSHMHAEYKSTSGSLSYGGIEADFQAPMALLETTFCGKISIGKFSFQVRSDECTSGGGYSFPKFDGGGNLTVGGDSLALLSWTHSVSNP
jgi:energy-coupling factor transporter ATP-binding protein EcfA2